MTCKVDNPYLNPVLIDEVESLQEKLCAKEHAAMAPFQSEAGIGSFGSSTPRYADFDLEALRDAVAHHGQEFCQRHCASFHPYGHHPECNEIHAAYGAMVNALCYTYCGCAAETMLKCKDLSAHLRSQLESVKDFAAFKNMMLEVKATPQVQQSVKKTEDEKAQRVLEMLASDTFTTRLMKFMREHCDEFIIVAEAAQDAIYQAYSALGEEVLLEAAEEHAVDTAWFADDELYHRFADDQLYDRLADGLLHHRACR